MFQLLGQFTTRFWMPILVVWVVLFLGMKLFAPSFESVSRSGEFGFLPADSPSLLAEKEFRKSFKKDLIGSLIAIVIVRENGKGLITDAQLEKINKSERLSDYEFVDTVLKPRIEEVVEELFSKKNSEPTENKQAEHEPAVRTEKDPQLGVLLKSDDAKATLITVELPTDFLDAHNKEVIQKIEEVLFQDKDVLRQMPDGLKVAVSGSATVGRDMMVESTKSAQATEKFTLILVVFLLIVIYRSPFLAVIPLLTVIVAQELAMGVISILAALDFFHPFSDLRIYVMILTYGAGIDYCLFLIARYKEELDAGATIEEGASRAVSCVGAPLAASAGTSIVGIGMMIFADFQKFQQSGIGISLGLFAALCASLTFAPALLRLAGRWVFWPSLQNERVTANTGWIASESPWSQWKKFDWLKIVWTRMSMLVGKYPIQILLINIAWMMPFAVCAVMNFNFVSYGLLNELPSESPSVVGAKLIQDHFPPGVTGPVTILIKNDSLDFSSDEIEEKINVLTENLYQRKKELKLADVRSWSHPLGMTENAKLEVEKFANSQSLVSKMLFNKRVLKQYVGVNLLSQNSLSNSRDEEEEEVNSVTRIDLIFQAEPFSNGNILLLDQVEKVIREEVEQNWNFAPEEGVQQEKTEVLALGTTASIRDLKIVTDADQLRIDLLVVFGVYFVLVLLLRKPAISVYLIASVLFSYFVTLGITFFTFWAFDPAGFTGLDWKVRFFLFTILIAIGEDYNIFLVTRIDEESKTYGSVRGVQEALIRTGTIISSGGVIMAGTFASLLAGSMMGMRQLGFALALGVLLDTFIVRPILVPSYLILLHQGTFGRLGKLLGAKPDEKASSE